jgi:hypothetical protein
VSEALKDGGRGTTGLSKLRISRLLRVFPLVGVGLCVKTFANLKNMPLCIKPDGVPLRWEGGGEGSDCGGALPIWYPDGSKIGYYFGGWRLAESALNPDAGVVRCATTETHDSGNLMHPLPTSSRGNFAGRIPFPVGRQNHTGGLSE